MAHQAEVTSQQIFALAEPWRSRFLQLLANWSADTPESDEVSPSPYQVKRWLSDPQLCSKIMALLRTWSHL